MREEDPQDACYDARGRENVALQVEDVIDEGQLWDCVLMSSALVCGHLYLAEGQFRV